MSIISSLGAVTGRFWKLMDSCPNQNDEIYILWMVLSKDNRGIVRKNNFQICVLECVHIDKHTLLDKYVPCTHTLLLLLLLLLLAFLVICVKLLFYLYYKYHTYLLMSIILYLTLNSVKKTPGFLISITISHITLFYYNQYQRSYDYFSSIVFL